MNLPFDVFNTDERRILATLERERSETLLRPVFAFWTCPGLANG